VELLVVITIIGLLVGMAFPAYYAVMGRAHKAVDAMEIDQLDTALVLFKAKFGSYPPDFADVDRAAAMQQTLRFIRQAWPRCQRLPRDFQGTDLPPQYNAGTAMPFWLGGVANFQLDPDTGRYLVEYVGFSADPTNPFDVDASGDPLPIDKRQPSRILPFMKFATNRFTGTPATFFGYWPTTDVTTAGIAGYVYFRAKNKTYATKGFPDLAHGAMLDGRIRTGTMPWLNTDSYQIRSCGRDGLWYSGHTAAEGNCWGHKLSLPETFDAGFPSCSTADDMGNCWPGTLGDNF